MWAAVCYDLMRQMNTFLQVAIILVVRNGPAILAMTLHPPLAALLQAALLHAAILP